MMMPRVISLLGLVFEREVRMDYYWMELQLVLKALERAARRRPQWMPQLTTL